MNEGTGIIFGLMIVMGLVLILPFLSRRGGRKLEMFLGNVLVRHGNNRNNDFKSLELAPCREKVQFPMRRQAFN
jgi:hypothetical protein